MKRFLAGVILAGLTGAAFADVYVLDSDTAVVQQRAEKRAAQAQDKKGDKPNAGVSAARLARLQKATGDIDLTDASGLRYFINTDITFNTSSSASAAASEASYVSAVAATTLNGGTASSTLNDMFDGYNSICVSLTGDTSSCNTSNANQTIYNRNGSPTLACNGRQVEFPIQAIGGLSVSRKVFVPTASSFIRWMNVFTNTTGAPISFIMSTGNNLGSDSNTRIVTSSSGDAVVTTADRWATTFQNFSGTTSSDPRIAHVFGSAGAQVGLNTVTFADGDDNPFWTYSVTLAPGQTGILTNYAAGRPSRAAAASAGAALAAFPVSAQECMTPTELTQQLNFVAAVIAPPTVVPSNDRWGLLMLGALLALGGILAGRSIFGSR